MIIGIGTDIVAVERIQHLVVKYKHKFVQRILTSIEQEYFQKTQSKLTFLAARFAAKEAFFKALGMGMRDGLSFQQICISNDSLGKPILHCEAKAEAMCQALEINHLHISLSHERAYATAFVVLSK